MRTANALPLSQDPYHWRILFTATEPIISISSFAKLNGSNSIRPKVFDGTQLRFYWIDDSIQVLPTQFDPRSLTGFDSVFRTLFGSWLSMGFDSVFPDLIRLTFNTISFDLSQSIQVTFHSGFRESHIGQGVFCKTSIEIVEYSTNMITKIVFGKNTLKKKNRSGNLI